MLFSLSCGQWNAILSIPLGTTSLILWQEYYYTSSSETTPKNTGKWIIWIKKSAAYIHIRTKIIESRYIKTVSKNVPHEHIPRFIIVLQISNCKIVRFYSNVIAYISKFTTPLKIYMHADVYAWCISEVLLQKQVSMAGTSNYIPQILWDVITCPCPWYLPLVQYPSYATRINQVGMALTLFGVLGGCA